MITESSSSNPYKRFSNVWDLKGNRLVHVQGKPHAITPDGKHVIVEHDKTLYVYDLLGNLETSLPHSDAINKLLFLNEEGTEMATLSNNSTSPTI